VQCLFTTKGEKKCVLVFLEGESIILKYTFTAVAHQLALKSVDLSADSRRVVSGPVHSYLLICRFARKFNISPNVELEIVLTRFHSLCRKQHSTLFVT